MQVKGTEINFHPVRKGNRLIELRCFTETPIDFISKTVYKMLDGINKNEYNNPMNSKEFKRWLAEQGAAFETTKSSHLKVYLGGKQSILPMHGTELKKGTMEAIKKQLGLK